MALAHLMLPLLLSCWPSTHAGFVETAQLSPGTPGVPVTNLSFKYRPYVGPVSVRDTLTLYLTPVPVFATPILNAGVSAPNLTVMGTNCTLMPISVLSQQCSWTVENSTAGECKWAEGRNHTIVLPSTYFASPLPSSLIAMDTNITQRNVTGVFLDSGNMLLAVQHPTISSVIVSPSNQTLNGTQSLGVSFLLSSSGLITTFFLQVTAIPTITSTPVFVVGNDQGTTITVGSCSGLYRQTTLYPSSRTVLWFQLSGPNYCTSTGNVTVTIPPGLIAPEAPAVGQQIRIQLLGLSADAHTVFWTTGAGNPSAVYNVSTTIIFAWATGFPVACSTDVLVRHRR